MKEDEIYSTWASLVRRNTVGGACNFQNAAIELAKLVADRERGECFYAANVALLGAAMSTRDRVLRAIRARGEK